MEYSLLSQEEGPCGDEQRKAHAPKMSRDSTYTENPAAHEHSNISRGREQSHGTKEKEHPSGNSTY